MDENQHHLPNPAGPYETCTTCLECGGELHREHFAGCVWVWAH